jgi:hypothetical protein
VRLALDRVVAWEPDRLAIDPWTVLRLARYRRREDAPAAVWDVTRAMTARAGELIRPAARLRLVRVTEVTADRAVVAGATFSGRAIGRHLSGARQAVAFVLTLGPALETEVVALGERHDLLEAYLLDLAGWTAIEAAARALRRALVTALPPAQVSHRLGPGHRDWPLGEQRDLLALLGGAGALEPAAVRLSEHGVLIPFKSISGLFALRS